MTPSPDPPWVRRTGVVLRPDPARVVTTLFLPGQELAAPGGSRSGGVVERILALSGQEVDAQLAELASTFEGRHRDLQLTWERHFELVRHRVRRGGSLSAARRRLIGAYFTQELAIEGAALMNPSMVPHPDQTGLAPGAQRFVMTVRAVGEGHLSSVELRTGVVDAADGVLLDAPPTVAVLPAERPAAYSRAMFEQALDDLGGDRADSDFVLAALPREFTRAELDGALGQLRAERLTRSTTVRTVERFEAIASSSYTVGFPLGSALQERVLMPRTAAESRGMEDVRLVRLDDGSGRQYAATYTGYDGRQVQVRMLRTDDFVTWHAAPTGGPGAQNKGLALFPRRIDGRYVALSRADRENNAVSTSADLQHWEEPVVVQAPRQPWEIVQLGNCGPPIETEAGWLVLTHGVGPMRRYSMGALLLDLDDPTVVRAALDRPFLTPADDERSGYVPNVVYSCGAMRHGRTLVLPYGCSDTTTRIAMVDLDALVGELVAGATATPRPRAQGLRGART
jgi:predicted GH43/DUF377 family glycosyl hydrolase